MSLEHAILGFLSYQPLSGYDLKKAFDTSIRHFWNADLSQIYRTLSRLEQAGQVSVELVEQAERPDRKVYHLTEPGRAELHRWLVTPLQVHQPNSAPLLQFFFSGLLSDAEALAMLEQAIASTRTVLERYHQAPRAAGAEGVLSNERQAFFGLLTLELGLRVAEAQLAWAESVADRLRRKDYGVLL